ncbi:MAG: N-acetylmuramoyl-L-alanine amidase [Actinobacteria bacterium]|nr:MAG: N-acetylmuramoyl-L-alanine amidase [Actinomycetota bacterium]
MTRVRTRTGLPAVLAVALLTLAGCGGGAPAAAFRGASPAGSASSGDVASADPTMSAPASSAAPTKAAAPAPVSGPLNLAAVTGKTIVIDPGHDGGNAAHPEIINQPVPMGTGTKACDTTGTQTNGGYQEAAFTFDVGTRLAALLRAAGAHVVMTRDSNTGVGPCVDQRAKIGNDAHAAVAISIHADGAPAAGHGFHVMTPARVGAPSNVIVDTSHQLAVRIRDNYRARTGIPTSTYIGQEGINVRADMGGLNLSVVPKVLVECGNMRNAGDAAMMTNPVYRQRMAEGLAAGLAAYLASVG